MIDREELEYVREEFNVDGLIRDILQLADAVAKAYKQEAGLKRSIRKVERDLEAVEAEMMEKAAEGRNEAVRRAMLAKMKEENGKYKQLTNTLDELRFQLDELRAIRKAAEIELNARRSICYLIGEVLGAVHAQRVYGEMLEEDEIDEVEEFTPSEDLPLDEEPPF